LYISRIGLSEIADQRRASIVDEHVDWRVGAQPLEDSIELGTVDQVGRDNLDRHAMRTAQFGSEGVEPVGRAATRTRSWPRAATRLDIIRG
jgi:hypothetical protein